MKRSRRTFSAEFKPEMEKEELIQAIGQLTVQNNWLKKIFSSS